jgi:hypothetical protein
MNGKPSSEVKRTPARPEVLSELDQFIKGFRSETSSYVRKWVITGLAGAVCLTVFAAWSYWEFRIKQMLGGVPKDAVLIFYKPECPEGWKRLENYDNREIVVAAPPKPSDKDAHPRPLTFNGTSRHVYGEYRLIKEPSGGPIADNEERVTVPGLLALTFCVKD